jgi:hypothetical protein
VNLYIAFLWLGILGTETQPQHADAPTGHQTQKRR